VNDETENIAAATASILGSASVEFDKVAGDTKLAAIAKTQDGPLNIDRGGVFWKPHDRVSWLIQIPDLTNVAYSFVRLGTDVSNYCEWRVVDASHAAGRFTLCDVAIGDAYVTGAGWDPSSVPYVVAGVAFDANANTLANLQWDAIWLEHATLVRT